MDRDDKPEEWREVAGHEGYEVSDQGRVRSWRKQGRCGGVRRTPLILAASPGETGYPEVSLYGPPRVTGQVHLLVLRAFVGPPKGLEARHLDGDSTNSSLGNLAWGTHIENMADMTRHGTRPYGEQRWNVKLTDDDVRDIRARAANGATQRCIAAAYNISQSNVSGIVQGKRWRHVSPRKGCTDPLST